MGSSPTGSTMKYYFVEVGPNRYEVRHKDTDEKFHVGKQIEADFEAGLMKKK